MFSELHHKYPHFIDYVIQKEATLKIFKNREVVLSKENLADVPYMVLLNGKFILELEDSQNEEIAEVSHDGASRSSYKSGFSALQATE